MAAYGPIAHGNDRPNPYTRIEPWGEGLMAFPHGFHVNYEGNVWTTDSGSRDAPGGHLVRKFSRKL